MTAINTLLRLIPEVLQVARCMHSSSSHLRAQALLITEPRSTRANYLSPIKLFGTV